MNGRLGGGSVDSSARTAGAPVRRGLFVEDFAGGASVGPSSEVPAGLLTRTDVSLGFALAMLTQCMSESPKTVAVKTEIVFSGWFIVVSSVNVCVQMETI